MPDEPTTASLCGHSGCTDGSCGVRYVGPTSHMRDHHIVHAARGVTHVWSAAIITGLAIVLTGAIAWSSAQAGTADPSADSDIRVLSKKIDRLEALIRSMNDKCQVQAKECAAEPTADSAEATQ